MHVTILFRISCNLRLSNNVKITRGWQGRNDLGLYLVGVHFEILTGHRLSRLRCFPGFPQPVHAKTGVIPVSNHDRFLPNFFQLIIHQSSYRSMLCGRNITHNKFRIIIFSCSLVCVWKISVSEPKRRRNPVGEIWGSYGSDYEGSENT
jgi:hypothetical protein